jgi:hypothetical protein
MSSNTDYTTEHLEWLKKIDAKLQQLLGIMGTINLIVLVIFILSMGNRFFGWNTPTIFKP